MQEETYAFIVRIWSETVGCDGKTATWRGSVDRVGSGQRLYFQNFERIGTLIQEQMGLVDPPPSAVQKLHKE